MTLTELAIKRPTFVVVIFTVLGVLGLLSFAQLKYELLPKISNPFVTITTVYPGAAPSEVETSVSKPVEDAVSGLDKIKSVRATSLEGVSIVTIEFEQSATVDVALQDAQRKVNEIVARFPEDVKAPVLTKFALDEIPVLRMSATSTMPEREFYQEMKERIKPRLSKAAGVGQITLVGGEEREIQVNVDADKLQSYGLSIMQVTQAIKAGNLDFPTGKIEDTDGQYVVRVAGKFGSIEDIRALIVGRSPAGGDIKLGDIAEVADGAKEATTISRLNGKTSIGVLIQKQTDANAVEVSKNVRKEVEAIQNDYKAKGVNFLIAQDGSTFTIEAANAVEFDLMLAIILVAVVMLVFLHSIRNSFIVLVAIPASFVATFIVMWVFGFSLNLMTLLGLSLVVGILVDDSIVVLENIYRHLEMGQDSRTAALNGRNEIGFTALSITLVDVVVFLPLSLISGLVGNIMREFAIVVVASTLMSLFVSFTITPVLASRISKLEHLTKGSLMGRFGLWFESLYDRLRDLYLRVLAWTIAKKSHGFMVLGGVLVLLYSMGVAGGFVGFEFITQSDRGEFTVTVETPPGNSLDATNQTTMQVERFIMAMPEVKTTYSNVGVSSEGLLGQSSNNSSEINVALVPKKERVKSTDEIGEAIKSYALSIPGVKVRVNPIGIFGTANQTPVQIIVSGQNLDSVEATASYFANILRKIQGTADIRLSVEDGKPETQVKIDREKMAALGLTIAEVGGALRVALNGDNDARFRVGTDEYDINIRLDEFDRSRTSDVESITFMNRRGEQVMLKQFADVEQSTGPTKLQRKDRNSAVTIFAQAVGRPVGNIGADFQAAIATYKFPAGVTLGYDGDLRNQQDSFGNMGIAFLVGIMFMYLIMVALYNSYLYPFVVLFSIPLALIGAFWALALAGRSMSIFSMLGVIMLIGLVGKNAILLVDFTNKAREEGKSIKEALMEAGRERLRPILMTTLTMIFGMLPIALSTAAGAEWKSGLAWALVGGLTSSMFLTLIVVPVIYWGFAGIQSKLRARKARRRARKQAKLKPGLEAA
ncbi:MAG: efflux RND transporter permease subunit [Chlorobi bacterium]|nr:efflux RND transporter permease subunit [Chlorobiota bacterium]